jgi:bacterioferritin-associated ferredoxin
MAFCATQDCENYTEGSTPYCGSCNHLRRKEEKAALKEKKIYVIKKISTDQAKKNRLYSEQRLSHLERYPFCQIKLIGCTEAATEVHHISGRGDNTNDTSTFKSACGNCHRLLHNVLSATVRREKGFLK